MQPSPDQALRHAIVYHNPSDLDVEWAVRGFTITPLGLIPDRVPFVCLTLDMAREMALVLIPVGYRVPCSPTDDPAIFEIWI